MNQTLQYSLLNNPRKLIAHIESRLDCNRITAGWMRAGDRGIKGSAVLFLLTQYRTASCREPELCLLLNKRSLQVLQPGDLCCPGGGIALGDKIISEFMPLPIFPIHKWSQWLRWRMKNRQTARRMMQVWTAGLREAWEEMRLNPLKVALLGPLPVQQLIMFRRLIFPLAAWVPSYPHLKPNREVARIVNVPLRCLLDPDNYGRYRLAFDNGPPVIQQRKEFPCFIHYGRQSTEILWGATFRITMDFLKIAFGFSPPAMDALPVVRGRRDAAYLNGSVWDYESSSHKKEVV